MSSTEIQTTGSTKKVLAKKLNYDDVLEHIGQLGKFQLRSFLLLCIPAFFPGIVIMSFTFTGGMPRYRCLVEGCENQTTSDFEPPWLNHTIPWENPDRFVRQCRLYNQTWSNSSECEAYDADVHPSQLCDNWVYDTSVFQSTIVSEFNLTCDDEWKQTLTGTMYMVGMLIGAITLGNLADSIGRKNAFTLTTFCLASVTTGTAFAPDFITFIVLRTLGGVLATGYFIILFVWGVEAVGQKYRVVAGFAYHLTVSVGSALLGVIAIYVRDWRTLQLVISVPLFLILSMYWIVPESTRWLINKRRYSEATKLILRAAEMNGKLLPVQFLVKTDEELDTESQTAKSSNPENIFDVFRSFVLCKRIILMSLGWVATIMGFYGITYSAANLSGDFHLNYILSMVVETPSYIVGIFAMDRLGRRATFSGCLIISGIACLITGLVPENPPAIRMTTSLIGKFFISCVLATVYSFTSELFPTGGRSAVLGLCATIGRIGGILAPILADIGRNVDQALPYIIFASVNIVVGTLCLFLPETIQSPLPATVQDAKGMEKHAFNLKFCKRDNNQNHSDDNKNN